MQLVCHKAGATVCKGGAHVPLLSSNRPVSSRNDRRIALVRAQSTPSAAAAQQADIKDSRNLPKEVLYLQATNPNKFAVTALDGHPFAITQSQTPAGPVDVLWLADPATMREWFKDEWKFNVTNWPPTISNLLGKEAMATVKDGTRHQQLRDIFKPLLTDTEVSRMVPGIQKIVQTRMAQWSKQPGGVKAFDELLTLVFEVIVNEGLQLGFNQADITKYTPIFEVWNQGFTPLLDPAPTSPYSLGMEARIKLIERFRQSFNSPSLKPASVPGNLKKAFGANSEVCTDNVIMFIFAGFEGTASAASNLLIQLAKNPAALKKVKEEQQRIKADAKAPLTLQLLQQMPYTVACIREVLRLSQIVANVPRLTTQPIDSKAGVKLGSKCPFSAAWGGMSVLDPAVKGKAPTEFKPERWLDPQNKESLEQYQNPFGWGTHDCLGRRIAMTTCCAIARELVLKYEMTADTKTEISDFPIGGRPKNALPLQLKALPAACK